MNWQSLAALALVGGISSALAAPTTQPLVPVSQIPVPQSREGGAAKTADLSTPSKIVILPLENLNDEQHRDWVGRAVQESLATEIARMGGLTPISAPAQLTPVDTAAALKAGKAYGGDTVIFGSYQFEGGNVRFTAQIIDVTTGKALGGLKASGDLRDLFNLEDVLARQTNRSLRPPPAHLSSVGPGNDSLIFGNEPATAPFDVLSRPMTSEERYADSYNRYYYNRDADVDSDIGYGLAGDEGFDGGFPFNYGYGFPIVIVTHGGRHGHMPRRGGIPIHHPPGGRTPGGFAGGQGHSR